MYKTRWKKTKFRNILFCYNLNVLIEYVREITHLYGLPL